MFPVCGTCVADYVLLPPELASASFAVDDKLISVSLFGTHNGITNDCISDENEHRRRAREPRGEGGGQQRVPIGIGIFSRAVKITVIIGSSREKPLD